MLLHRGLLKARYIIFFHWLRWVYLHFSNSLLTCKVVLNVIYKYCLYNPLLHQPGSSECMAVVFVPGKWMQFTGASHMHWQEAMAHLDKTQGILTSDFTIRSFISISPSYGVSSPHNSHTLAVLYSILWTPLATRGVRAQPDVSHSCSLKWIRAGLTCFPFVFYGGTLTLNAFIRDFCLISLSPWDIINYWSLKVP